MTRYIVKLICFIFFGIGLHGEPKANLITANINLFVLPIMGPSYYGLSLNYERMIMKNLEVGGSLITELTDLERYQGGIYGLEENALYTIYSFNPNKRNGFYIGSHLGIFAGFGGFSFSPDSAAVVFPCL